MGNSTYFKSLGINAFEAFWKDPNGPVQTAKTIKPEARNFHGHLLAKWVDGQGKTLRLRRCHMQKFRPSLPTSQGCHGAREGPSRCI